MACIIESTFFPVGRTYHFLVVISVENGEKPRCQDIASVILLNTSRMSFFNIQI